MAYKLPFEISNGHVISGEKLDANFEYIRAKIMSLTKSDFRESAAIQNRMKAYPRSYTAFSFSLDRLTQNNESREYTGLLYFHSEQPPSVGSVGGVPIVGEPFTIEDVQAGYYAASKTYSTGFTIVGSLYTADSAGARVTTPLVFGANVPQQNIIRQEVPAFEVSMTVDNKTAGDLDIYGIFINVIARVPHVR